MGKFVLALLIGALLGGAVVFLTFVGPSRSAVTPGEPIRAPDPSGAPAGTVELAFGDQFFNEVLGTIFRDMKPPSFALTETRQSSSAGTACLSQITILPEGSGVRTGVRFENDLLRAPLAFTGSYESVFGCLEFTGWAQARMDMRFEQASQSVFGQLTVETVNLDGVNPIFSALITPIVQGSINSNVNPIRIIDGKQLAVDLPIAASGANLRAGVNDVRAQVKDSKLNLYVTYGFGTANSPVP